MPYEQYAEFIYHELPTTTKYRFAEVEMSEALKSLRALFKYDTSRTNKAEIMLYNMLVPNMRKYEINEPRFLEAMNNPFFRKPRPDEMINYLLYRQQAYRKIREITSSSFNTISKYRFKQLPFYLPLFPDWDETLLDTWNDIKTQLNLFNETLIQMK